MKTNIMPKGTYGILSGYLHESRCKIASKYVSKDDVVLDVGCGTGELVDFLPKGVKYYGIDPRKLWSNSDKHLHVAKIGDPLPKSIPKKLTTIVSLAVIEHLDTPVTFFQYASSLLPTYGTIIVTTPHPISRSVHDTGASLGLFSKNASDDHEQFLDKSTLSVLAAKAGCTLIHYQKFLFGMNQVAVFVKN